MGVSRFGWPAGTGRSTERSAAATEPPGPVLKRRPLRRPRRVRRPAPTDRPRASPRTSRRGWIPAATGVVERGPQARRRRPSRRVRHPRPTMRRPLRPRPRRLGRRDYPRAPALPRAVLKEAARTATPRLAAFPAPGRGRTGQRQPQRLWPTVGEPPNHEAGFARSVGRRRRLPLRAAARGRPATVRGPARTSLRTGRRRAAVAWARPLRAAAAVGAKRRQPATDRSPQPP